MKHYGSCLCGEVTYEIEGDFGHFFLCHCSHCRKDTGSAHAANLFAWQTGVKWLTGEAKVKTFHLPGTRHMKSFCSDCGSALPCLQEDGALLVVPAGSLDTDVPLRPDAHICMADRANWDEALEKVRMLDELPEG